jgi:SpoIIAA-like
MIEMSTDSSGRTLGVRAIGEITQEDYRSLSQRVETLLEQEQSIGVLIDLEQFAGEARDAWKTDLQFGKAFRRRIGRMAIVGDKRWEQLIAVFADPFYARDSRFFHTSQREAARKWVSEE